MRKLKSTRPPWKRNHFGEKDARWKRFADKKRGRVARYYQREALKTTGARFFEPVSGVVLFVRRLVATAKAIWCGSRGRRW